VCIYESFSPGISWKSLKRLDINVNVWAKQRANKQKMGQKKRLILCIFRQIWLRKRFPRKSKHTHKQTLICYHKYLIIFSRQPRICGQFGLRIATGDSDVRLKVHIAFHRRISNRYLLFFWFFNNLSLLLFLKPNLKRLVPNNDGGYM
jgi:hypothetical protein